MHKCGNVLTAANSIIVWNFVLMGLNPLFIIPYLIITKIKFESNTLYLIQGWSETWWVIYIIIYK